MLALFFPLQRSYDPDADGDRFSTFTRLRGTLAVLASAPVAPGHGRASVDGVPLTCWDAAELHGLRLLFIPVGEVARDYGKRHRVVLEGFCTPDGRRFPRRAIRFRTATRRERVPEYDAQDAKALEAAREGMVLLRNENGVLPLRAGATLNCLGRAQHLWHSSATGASRINPRWSPDLRRAVAGHSRFKLNEELSAFFRDPRAGVPDAEMLARAREQCDAALVFIERHSGEMMDNRPIPGEYYLTEGELALLRAARAAFSRVIVILNTGYPIGMGWLSHIPVDAVLHTGFAGMLGSWALMEILDGRVNPSGHLPDTWPWDWRDDPVSRNFPALGADDPEMPEDATGVRVYYEEDVYLGYRWFDTFGVPVAFPFGHGLSYMTFALAPKKPRLRDGGVTLSVAVTNTGDRPGKAVVQLYVAPPRGRLERPAHILIGFDKTKLLAQKAGRAS